MLKNKINIKKESPYLIMGLPAVIVFVTFLFCHCFLQFGIVFITGQIFLRILHLLDLKTIKKFFRMHPFFRA